MSAQFCNCYVSKLKPETQFSLRYGAHALACPVYRVSRDPVDAADDSDFRAAADYHLEQSSGRFLIHNDEEDVGAGIELAAFPYAGVRIGGAA